MKPKNTYYENGNPEYQRWTYYEHWRNEGGSFHRLDGPARRSWYPGGQVRYEEWYVNGDYHRLDGPAYRGWDERGQLEDEVWYINGVRYETEAEFQVAVDLYKADEIAELF